MATMEGEEEGEKKEEEDDYDEEEEEEEDQEDERRADKSWPLVNEHWLATVSGVLSLFLFLSTPVISSPSRFVRPRPPSSLLRVLSLPLLLRSSVLRFCSQ